MALERKFKIDQIVPELYPRVVQYNRGIYYDGLGNILNNMLNPGLGRIAVYSGTPSTYQGYPNFTWDGSKLTIGIDPNALTLTDSGITFNKGVQSYSATAGFLYYDKNLESLAYYSNVSPTLPIYIGREVWVQGYNLSGSTMSKGQAVYISGSTNSIPIFDLSIANQDSKSRVDGLLKQDLSNGQTGQAISFGIFTGVNVDGFVGTSSSIGDVLWLSDTVAGGYTTENSDLQYSSRSTSVGYVVDTGTNSGRLWVDIRSENTNQTITNLQRNILEGNVLSTGIFLFPSPGLTISGTASFNVSPMKGWIVTNTGSASIAPTVKLVEFPGAIGVTATYLLTDTQTYLYVTSTGSLIQQNTFPSPQQRRENIYLGKFGHANKLNLINAFPEPDLEISPLSQLRDMFTPIKLINDGVYPSSNGANLQLNISSGKLWGLGIGWTLNELNPSSITVPGSSPVTFQYRIRTGGTFSDTTLVDPTHYDLNGVYTVVGGGANTSTNQRIYLVQNGRVRIQYGQTTYGSLADAVTAVANESFTPFVNFRDNGILIGILSVVRTATNLSDPTQARILLVSKFGETIGAAGGISTTSLQQAYNNSSPPQIVTNAIQDGVQIRRGSAADTDNVLVVQNGAGSNTFYVRGDGYVQANDLIINGGKVGIGTASPASKFTIYSTQSGAFQLKDGTEATGYVLVSNSQGVGSWTYFVSGGVTGPQGSTGPQGPTGPQGATGPIGLLYYKDAANYVHSGTTSNTILNRVLIPANTVKVDDILTIEVRMIKGSATASFTPGYYINSSLSLSGAQEIHQSAVAAAIRWVQHKRDVKVSALTGASNEILNSSLAQVSDTIALASASPFNLRTVDWTVDNYVFSSAQLTNATQTVTGSYITVKIFR